MKEFADALPLDWPPRAETEVARLIEQVRENAEPAKLSGRISGVYFLLKEGEIVYVGQSKNIIGRIDDHINQKVKKFDRFTIMELPDDQRCLRERQFIAALRPFYNVSTYTEQGLRKCHELADELGVSCSKITNVVKELGLASVGPFVNESEVREALQITVE